MTENKKDESKSEKTERNEAVQKGVPKEAEHSSVESINEPPGSDVLAGVPEPGESTGPGLEAAQQSQQQEEQRQAKQAQQPRPQPKPASQKAHSAAGDPDELEDEIDEAEEEGDIEQHKPRGEPPKKGKR